MKIKNVFQIKNLYWLFLFIVLLFAHYKNTFDSDEGVILEGAWNLFNGKELYNDFFEFIPPGSFYFIFILWKLFSPNFYIAKLASIFIFFFSSVGIFKICELLQKNKLNYLPPAIFIGSSFFWPLINHNTFNLFFLIYATFFFIRSIQNKKNKDLVVAGILSFMSIYFLQQKGLVLIGVNTSWLLGSFLYKKNNNYIKKTTIYLTSSLLPLFFLFIKWSPIILYRNIIEFALTSYTNTNKMPYGITVFFLIATLIFWLALKNQKSKIITYLLFLEICLLISTIPRPDHYHVLLIIFPLYILLPLLIKKITFYSLLPKIIYSTIILVVLSFLLQPSISYILYNPPLQKSKIYEVVDYIKKNCPRNNDLYAGPFIPGLYFESKKINFTPYYILIPNFQSKNDFFIAEKSLKENQPACIVMNYKIVDKFKYDKNNPVDNYIQENYKLEKQIINDLIFIKKDASLNNRTGLQ